MSSIPNLGSTFCGIVAQLVERPSKVPESGATLLTRVQNT